MSIDLSALLTERRNANSANIDTLSTVEMLTVINQEDQQVPHAIAPYLPQIAQVVDKVAAALQAGGRLIYIGAGTSGAPGDPGCQRMSADFRYSSGAGGRGDCRRP
ncbi:N-acetylmuramic acid 6-phosphate etherase [Raoultella planticola]|nr:N-acetylmuramic acid 6-phosphate etherase [Raoultella planticola]